MKEKIFKKGITRRLLSVVLAMAMVLTFMPLSSVTVFAASYSSFRMEDREMYYFDKEIMQWDADDNLTCNEHGIIATYNGDSTFSLNTSNSNCTACLSAFHFGLACDVYFEMNGHGDEIEEISAIRGTTIQAPETPIAEGYTFGGWYTTEECEEGTKWNFDSDLVDGSYIDLYAKWTETTHAWTYSVNGATLTATCDQACGELTPHTATLTLTASDAHYSGSAVTPTINFGSSTEKTAWTDAGLTVPTVASMKYYATDADGKKTGSEMASVSALGRYIVDVTIADIVDTNSSAITVSLPFQVCRVVVTEAITDTFQLTGIKAGDKIYFEPADPGYKGVFMYHGSELATPAMITELSSGDYHSAYWTAPFDGTLRAGTEMKMGDRSPKVWILFLECSSSTELIKHDGQAATHTEDGWIDYYECPDCHLFYEDADKTTLITIPDTTTFFRDNDLAIYMSNWKAEAGKIAKGHDISYTAENETITVSCSRDASEEVTLTIMAISPSYSETKVYPGAIIFDADGTEIRSDNTNTWTSSVFGLSVPEIKYYKATSEGGTEGTEEVTGFKGLALGNYYAAVTVGTVTAKKAFKVLPPHTHAGGTAGAGIEWDGVDALPLVSGNYYLLGDISLTDSWNIPTGEEINLCLNGYSIKRASGLSDDNLFSLIKIAADATLNLYDCKDSGKITGGLAYNGGGVYIGYPGNFNMYGGSIQGNTVTDGGGAGVYNYGGNFNMYAGSIEGNTATIFGVGGVYNYYGNFNMYAGSIKNNAAKFSGGVYNLGGNMNMYGGIITGNKTTQPGGGVYSATTSKGSFNVGGKAVIKGNKSGADGSVDDNLLLYNEYGKNSIIGLAEGANAPAEGMEIHYTVGKWSIEEQRTVAGTHGNDPITMVTGATSAQTKCFISDNPDMHIVYNNGELKIMHDWNYLTDGAEVKAYCFTGCESGAEDADHALVLTLSAEPVEYTASAITPVIEYGSEDEQTAWTASELIVPAAASVKYFAAGADGKKTGSELAQITEVGKYIVEVNIAAGAIAEGSSALTASVPFRIKKVAGSGSVTMADWTYGETAPDPVPSSTTNGTGNVTYLYTADGINYSPAKPVNVGEYAVKAIFAETDNYDEYTTEPYYFAIAKADASSEMKNAKGNLLAYAGSTRVISFNGLPEDAVPVIVEGVPGELDVTAVIENQALKLTVGAEDLPDDAKTFYMLVSVDETGNYYSYEIEVAVTPTWHVHVVDTTKKHAAVPSTCIRKGTRDWYECADSTCDYMLDENAEELDSIVLELDPLNHDGTATTWTRTETTHIETYNCCNAVRIEETEHSYGLTGIARYTCMSCSFVHEGKKAAVELADAKEAALKAIEAEVGGDTAENVLAAAEEAIEAITKAETVDDVNAAKDAGIAAIRAAKRANIKYTIPVRGDESAVKVQAEINDKNAVIGEITDETLSAIVKEAKKAEAGAVSAEDLVDTITIDLSAAKQEIVAVTLSTGTIETLADTLSDASNTINKVEIKLTDATVTFDSKALNSLAEQITGKDVTLVVNSVDAGDLNAKQQKALKNDEVMASFDIYLVSEGGEIHKFDGGQLDFSINFEAEEDTDPKYCHVVYVAENGDKEYLDTEYVNGIIKFSTLHCSNYVIVYDESRTNNSVAVPDKEQIAKNNKLINVGLISSIKSGKLTVKWSKIDGAMGYDVFVAACDGKSFAKKPAYTAAADETKAVLTEYKGEDFAAGSYKVKVRAFMIIDGKKIYIAKSSIVHASGNKSKYTNPKTVSVNETAVTLAKGETAQLEAKMTVANSKKKVMKHMRGYRFFTLDKDVATVDKSGKIVATGSGSTTVYVMAANGVKTAVKVTVK